MDPSSRIVSPAISDSISMLSSPQLSGLSSGGLLGLLTPIEGTETWLHATSLSALPASVDATVRFPISSLLLVPPISVNQTETFLSIPLGSLRIPMWDKISSLISSIATSANDYRPVRHMLAENAILPISELARASDLSLVLQGSTARDATIAEVQSAGGSTLAQPIPPSVPIPPQVPLDYSKQVKTQSLHLENRYMRQDPFKSDQGLHSREHSATDVDSPLLRLLRSIKGFISRHLSGNR